MMSLSGLQESKTGLKMERLPPEIVQKVSSNLSPRDLAHCCAVCRQWRVIFNQDWLWKSFCDPKLEEQLRTTPSVVKPVFTPPSESPTLSPVCFWRLAYLREHHLWQNWKHKIYKRETLTEVNNPKGIYFLTNNAFVRWSPKQLEVWDVSDVPATCIAKTEPFPELGIVYCSAVGSSTLLALTLASVRVFHVDLLNKCVKLKHDILIGGEGDSVSSHEYFNFFLKSKKLNSVKGNILLHVNRNGSMEIFDLEIGTKVKEEPCPLKGKALIQEVKSFSTSDDVLVLVYDPGSSVLYKYYIYNLKQLQFLPGPIASTFESGCGVLHKHYFALGAEPMKIVNYQTSEVLFENKGQELSFIPVGFNDSIIFIDHKDKTFRVEMFSLAEKAVNTVCTYRNKRRLHSLFLKKNVKVINNKFVLLFSEQFSDLGDIGDVWECAGKILERSNVYFPHGEQINKGFTRSVKGRGWPGDNYIYYHW